jgi:hypothetical protein
MLDEDKSCYDPITSPEYVCFNGFQSTYVIREVTSYYPVRLAYWAGQVGKYWFRAPRKVDGRQLLQDLKKARFYLDEMIKDLEATNGPAAD